MRPLSLAVAFSLILAPLAAAWQSAPDPKVQALLSTLDKIGSQGAGSVEAQKAWKELSLLAPASLPQIISAMDQHKPINSNYVRSAVTSIIDSSRKTKKALPTQALRDLLKDKTKNAAARGLALEILKNEDSAWVAGEIPSFVNESAPDLRRDAVAYWINQGDGLVKEKKDAEAKATFKKALAGASDKDQVDKIAKQLKSMGETVDLSNHFGFIRKWSLIGPFDSTKGKGFQTRFTPEEGVNLDATLEGKEGEKLKWIPFQSEDAYGLVDLNKVLGKKKDAIAFAYTRINSPAPAKVYIRAGCITALKVFVNNKEAFAREEYHHGMSMDQHAAVIHLEKGVNEILVKVCQNNQTESWAQKWEFQLRLTDAAGVKVPYSIAMEGSKK